MMVVQISLYCLFPLQLQIMKAAYVFFFMIRLRQAATQQDHILAHGILFFLSSLQPISIFC